jgi:hypothetical protein
MRTPVLFLPKTHLFVRLIRNVFLFGSCSLVVLGNFTEFERGILCLSENLTFDVDARINLFEVMIFDYCYCYHILQDFRTKSSTAFFLIVFDFVMQCNIRLLGGLISAHLLAKDYSSHLKDGLYQDQLLHLAENLGNRFLPAFETPTGLPYAWINLKVHTKLWIFSDFRTDCCMHGSILRFLYNQYKIRQILKSCGHLNSIIYCV